MKNYTLQPALSKIMGEKSPSTVFHWIIIIFAFVINLYRAISLSATYDEVWTITDFVPQSFFHILNYIHSEANNHILNTLLVKLLYMSGIETLFWARLPNVLAFGVYLITISLISKRLKSVFLQTVFILTMTLNPFIFDFFSIARGYGLAISLQALSILYIIKYIEKQSNQNIITSLCFAALSVTANFTFINHYLGILSLILPVFLISKSKRSLVIYLTAAILITSLLAAFSYQPLKTMIVNDMLYYGGDKGFYEDTVISLCRASMYTHHSSTPVKWAASALTVLFICTSLALIVNFIISKSSFIKKYLIQSVLLLIMLIATASTIVQNYLFDTFFLIDRTALLYYNLFFITLFFLSDIFTNRVIKIIIPVLLIIIPINFISNINLHKTLSWDFDSRTEQIITFINNKGKEDKIEYSIDFSWPFERVMNYYLKRKRYENISSVKLTDDRDKCNPEADYYVYLGRDLHNVNYFSSTQCIHEIEKDSILVFHDEEVYLFRLRK